MFARMEGLRTTSEALGDFSPAATERQIALFASFLAAPDEPQYQPHDEVDRIAVLVFRERLAVQLNLATSGEFSRTFSVLWSPVSSVRQVFELLPTETPDDRAEIGRLLDLVPETLASWVATLEVVASRGELPAARHIEGIAAQAATIGDNAFTDLVTRIEERHGPESQLHGPAERANAAFTTLAATLRAQFLPHTSASDYVGAERYAAWAQYYVGADLDLDELYAWGWEDLQRINQRMEEIRLILAPEVATWVELAAKLDADPERRIDGAEALLAQLRALTEATTAAMDGVHFEIDPRIRTCEVRLAPAGSASAPYYIPPTEDLSRPGTTWFPTLGETSFTLWRHVSTWYHEAVPGHHLQCATSLLQAEKQSRFHRIAGWTSGYGEGWALYAERLMEELGGFTDLADELGYLSGQALRAARIVVDLGMHLQLRVPEDLGVLVGIGDCSGEVWTPEMAVALLEQRAIMEPADAASEVDRYLGVPGQAISYKVGERVWLRARREAEARLGAGFDLRAWHKFALELGPLGLDDFAAEMARF